MDCTQLPAREEHIQVFNPIQGKDRNPVAFPYTSLVSQPVRQAVGALVHLPVCQA
jgi:hypothetical protein